MRARSIKPQFFTDDRVVELTPWARLLFIGLWCEADRAGRLFDKPKQLKLHLFPVDNLDINGLLAEIEAQGLIIRYAADGAGLIQVVNFSKHQSPHVREPASTLPAPGEHQASTGRAGARHTWSDTTDGGTILTADSGLRTADCGYSVGAPCGATPVENSSEGTPAADDFRDIDFGEDDPPEDHHTDAQKLTSLYVDEHTRLGRSKPTRRQIGIVAQIVGEKLGGGAEIERVREAIKRLVAAGKPPSVLPAIVSEVEAERARSAPRNTFPPPEPPMTPEEKRANWQAFEQSEDGQRLLAMIHGVGRAMP